MNVTPSDMIKLIDLGLTTEQLRGVMDMLEAKPTRGASAERMARKRLRDASQSAQCDVTCDATKASPLVPPSLSPTPPNSPPYNPPIPKSKPAKPHAEPNGFDGFWQAYPNKTGKPKALEAYRRALTRVPAEQILAGLKRVKPGWDDPKFIPHPSTWLNRDGWNDQAPTAANTQTVAPEAHTANWTLQKWQVMVKYSNDRDGVWDERWGPPPDDPQTLCPIDLRPTWNRKAA